MIWRKLDCLNPNLQGRKVTSAGKPSETGAVPVHRPDPVVGATSGVRPMPSEGIQGDEWGAYVVLLNAV